MGAKKIFIEDDGRKNKLDRYLGFLKTFLDHRGINYKIKYKEKYAEVRLLSIKRLTIIVPPGIIQA